MIAMSEVKIVLPESDPHHDANGAPSENEGHHPPTH